MALSTAIIFCVYGQHSFYGPEFMLRLLFFQLKVITKCFLTIKKQSSLRWRKMMKRSLQLVRSLSIFILSFRCWIWLHWILSLFLLLKNVINTLQALSASKIVRRMKLKFSKAWISFLKLPLPIDVYKEVT